MTNVRKYLAASLLASALSAMPISAALAQQPQPPSATESSPAYGPGMMGYGYGPGYGMGPGIMGYGSGGYGMGPGMMGGSGYGMGPGMMGGSGYGMGPGMMGYGGYGMGPGMMGGFGLARLDLSNAQIDKISKIRETLFRTQTTLMTQMFKARLSAQEQIDAVLTKEQKAELQRGWGGRGRWGMMGY